MTREKGATPTVQVAVRLPRRLVEDADELARGLSTEAMQVTRSDALRLALQEGMLRLIDLGVPAKP